MDKGDIDTRSSSDHIRLMVAGEEDMDWSLYHEDDYWWDIWFLRHLN